MAIAVPQIYPLAHVPLVLGVLRRLAVATVMDRLIPPDTTLSIPTPPPLVIDEDTSGSLQITASASGARPGTIVLG